MNRRSARCRPLSSCFGCSVVLLFACALLLASHVAAQETQPTVSIVLGVDRQGLYQYETFTLTVTLVSSGVTLGKNLSLEGMPDADTLIMDPIEALPIQRSLQGRTVLETRHYRARCRALKSGILRVAPVAGATQIVQRRSFFGRQWVEQPIRLPVKPIDIPVSEVPAPPQGLFPSGAVGTFTYTVTPEPLDVAVGDLIKLHTRLSGDGYLDNVVCPAAAPGRAFKVYPPRLVAERSNAVEFEQILIPLSTNALVIPPLTFTSFDARGGEYQTQTQGPFHVTFHAQRERDQSQPYRSANQTNHTRTPVLMLSDQIDRWKQQVPPRGKEAVIVIEPVTARLAPASVAQPLFDCKPGDILTITEETVGWISVQRSLDMGWIPLDAVMRR